MQGGPQCNAKVETGQHVGRSSGVGLFRCLVSLELNKWGVPLPPHTHTRTDVYNCTQAHFSAHASLGRLTDGAAWFILVAGSGAQLVLETGGLAELCSRQQTHTHRDTHTLCQQAATFAKIRAT